MRIVFAGTPTFAHIALIALYAAGHDILAVLTQPDRPSGRGMKLMPGAVKQAALTLGLPVWQPATLRDATVHAELLALHPDVMVVAAYGQLLPQAVLDIPQDGCLNIHASLLPRWRGAAPIHRAIAAGDQHTGITIMQMDAGLDTGAIGLQQAITIDEMDTTGSLHDRLAQLGGELIVRAVQQLADKCWHTHPQAVAGITYAAKISRSDALLDFHLDAAQLQRHVRAFNPAPGAYTLWQEQPLKIWQAHVIELTDNSIYVPCAYRPGQVLCADQQGIVTACGQHALCITELQPAGSKRQSAGQFLAGHTLTPGELITQLCHE